MEKTNYGFTRTVDLSFNEAIERVTAELQNEGFGVLTEIDVKATMRKKLNVDFNEYRILGACNPTFAYKALLAEEQIGLLLPCNVIVYVSADNQAVVSAINPTIAMNMVDNLAVGEVAGQISEKLEKVIANV